MQDCYHYCSPKNFHIIVAVCFESEYGRFLYTNSFVTLGDNVD